MDASIVTVGDEILAGDTENTNATWLAAQLAERGVDVREIVVLPDEEAVIASRVRRLSDTFDAVIVTGGIGGTPDDVTVEAVAAAFDRPLVLSEEAHADVLDTLEEIEAEFPDLDVDDEAEASIPEGARPLRNRVGLSPGVVVENVYVFPGLPPEMKAMFEDVADEFDGDLHTRMTRTARPEANIVPLLEEARDEFGVRVGSYPEAAGGEKRIKVTGEDEARVESAFAWLSDRLE